MTNLINESDNHKGVCKTAPATPGLLNILILEGEKCRQCFNTRSGYIARLVDNKPSTD